MNLYISDTHFGHAGAIKFDHRPFLDAGEMDQTLIRLWNDRVHKDDTVYILGDFCYETRHSAEWYLRQLKGHKILISGNHDSQLLNNPKALHYLDGVDKILEIMDGDKRICLCHYPIAEWNGFYRGAWHIYGHIHNQWSYTFDFMYATKRALNAGCMINNYAPASFRELTINNKAFFDARTGLV